MAKKRKSDRKKWRNRCDKLWSQIVRSVGHCELCNAEGTLHAHHLINRQAVFYRHHLENGICLCPTCHLYDLRCGAHSAPLGFADMVKNNHRHRYAWWQENRHNLHIGEKPDYQDIHAHLKAVLDKQKTYKWLAGRLICEQEAT